MKNLSLISNEELVVYKKQILDQIENNKKDYKNKYSNNTSSYGDSINDDYNGEGDEYSGLTRINMEIQKELIKRGIKI